MVQSRDGDKPSPQPSPKGRGRKDFKFFHPKISDDLIRKHDLQEPLPKH